MQSTVVKLSFTKDKPVTLRTIFQSRHGSSYISVIYRVDLRHNTGLVFDKQNEKGAHIGYFNILIEYSTLLIPLEERNNQLVQGLQAGQNCVSFLLDRFSVMLYISITKCAMYNTGGFMKKRSIWFLIAGIIILILAFVLADLSLHLYHILMQVGFFVIAFSVYLSNMPRDERSKGIGNKSLAWSWIVTFIVLVLLLWNSGLRPGSLTVPRVLFILFWTMLVSTAIFYRWLYHRGGSE